jgi:hypothetical protein
MVNRINTVISSFCPLMFGGKRLTEGSRKKRHFVSFIKRLFRSP